MLNLKFYVLPFASSKSYKLRFCNGSICGENVKELEI